MARPPAGVVTFVSEATKTRTAHATSGDRRLDRLIAGCPDAFLEVDRGGVVVEWNAAAESAFGWSRDETMKAERLRHRRAAEKRCARAGLLRRCSPVPPDARRSCTT